MAAEEDVDLDQVWRSPAGTLAPWIQGLLLVMCVATVVIASHGIGVAFGSNVREDASIETTRRGLWCGVAFLLTFAFVPRFRVSRFVRLATLMPVIHFAAVLVGATLWLADNDKAVRLVESSVLMLQPAHIIAAVGLAAVVGWWCAAVARAGRVRFREWLHTMLVFVLALTFVLGAWLPIVSGQVIGRDVAAMWFQVSMSAGVPDYDLRVMHLTVLVPPILIATVFATVASRWPRLVQQGRDLLAVLVVVLLMFSYGSQHMMTPAQCTLYIALMPLLLVAVGLANATLIASGAAEWIARRRAWGRVRIWHAYGATIAPDPDEPAGEPVAELEIVSWLRAPRTWTRPFSVRTARAELPLDGTELVAAIPAGTTVLSPGERIALARTGQLVTLYGDTHAADGDPFRSMPRSGDVSVVTDPDGARHGFLDVALLMWRPCVAYLLIMLALAIPVIRSLIAMRS